MRSRWLITLNMGLPALDLHDLNEQLTGGTGEGARQNMPEVSQIAYLNSLAKECAIGDYVSLPNNSIKVSEEVRLCMVTVIVEVHRLKGYKEETLYLATSLADRYLALLTILEQPSPCLIRLAFVCVLIAAKLEEPMQPSFNRMVRLIKSEHDFDTTKEELITLEQMVITLLDWDLQIVTPIFFLERYQRIFGVDREASDPSDARVVNLARKMLRYMLLSSVYLRFKPSQVAAAALILSININSSHCSQLMGAPCVLQRLEEKAFYHDPAAALRFAAQPAAEESKEGQYLPMMRNLGLLERWNDHVAQVTGLSAI